MWHYLQCEKDIVSRVRIHHIRSVYEVGSTIRFKPTNSNMMNGSENERGRCRES